MTLKRRTVGRVASSRSPCTPNRLFAALCIGSIFAVQLWTLRSVRAVAVASASGEGEGVGAGLSPPSPPRPSLRAATIAASVDSNTHDPAPPESAPGPAPVGEVPSVDPALVAARHRLARIAQMKFSRENPLQQDVAPPVVLHPPEPRSAASLPSPVKVRTEVNKKAPRGMSGEHVSNTKWLYDKYFSSVRNGVYIESGALDGVDGSNTIFFDKFLGWSGLLVEPNPVNFAKLLRTRPHAYRVEMALSDTPGSLDMMGDFGSVVGAVAHMGSNFKGAFHGSRSDTYAVASDRIDTWLKAAGLTHVDLWVLDVEGAELVGLKGMDFDAIFVDVIMVEMNDAHGKAHLEAVRQHLKTHGFSFQGNLGNMNEVWRNTRQP